ncbi:hypothetical protein BZL35_00485 [Candidatus Pandoraea novymonadis]|uniref:Uncharacterized protein n=1 Tax=Candidatus Pandoraea novymonadis TaxID=1808959 RepID=A0ABX5FEW0_9BURK|nr:hypothetical protein BZL35_00485 [Candidatus Pandoraea novymonadis]
MTTTKLIDHLLKNNSASPPHTTLIYTKQALIPTKVFAINITTENPHTFEIVHRPYF